MPAGERRWGFAIVHGRSMEPTMRDGDRLLIRYGAEPGLGQAVVVRLPGRPLAVKRVTRREPDGWWVERDNPAEGVDSWLVGTIAPANVVATVVLRVWPRPSRLRPRRRTG
jgi:signal peptidase I